MLRWMALIWQIPKEALRLRRIEPVKKAAVLLALADEAGPDGWCRVPTSLADDLCPSYPNRIK